MEFLQSGYDDQKKLDSYDSHYSISLERCLVRIETRDATSIRKFVEDAFERRVLAAYFWTNTGNKKYWDVAPAYCEFIPMGKPKVICNSEEQFDKYTNMLMEN